VTPLTAWKLHDLCIYLCVTGTHKSPHSPDTMSDFTTTNGKSSSTDSGRQLRISAPQAFRLVVYPPTKEPTQYFGAGSVTIGRGSENTIQVGDSRVSRNHAVIRRRRDGRFEISDSSSRNGTFVAGYPVADAVLAPTDVIRVGDTVMVWEAGPAEPSALPWNWSMVRGQLQSDIRRFAQNNEPLLLLGPTGSGKSWLAEQVARQSEWSSPFVQVNCASLPPTLIESELFGAMKGSFTGSSSDRVGLIESAQGGTLFLDEIGTLPMDMQAKLLTTIEKQEIRRVGSNRPVQLRMRIIAATNLDIDDAVENGTFRQDLYFRLAARELRLPPLTLRRVDIVPTFCELLALPPEGLFSAECLEALLIWSWRGNFRELRNVASQLPVGTQPFDYTALPAEMARFLQVRQTGHTVASSAASADPEQLKAVLERNEWNVTATARELGKHRMQIQRWMKRFGLRDRPDSETD